MEEDRKLELENIIKKMEEVSKQFYGAAVLIGNHTFIEFTGLINEYIKACEVTLKEGIDFTDCSVHTGKQLVVKDYMLKYLNEKLGCIYSEKFQIVDVQTLPEVLQKSSAE